MEGNGGRGAAAAEVRVMVVDDSAVIRGLLSRIIEAESDLRVVASAANGRTALELLRHKDVDVVLLDVEMPEMDGLAALPRMLELRPQLPVIMASSLTSEGAEVTLRALALGAADAIAKPSSLSASRGLASVAVELLAKIRGLGRARLLAPPAPSTLAAAPARAEAGTVGPGSAPALRAPAARADEPVRLVAIASSTGGPNALTRLLGSLGPEFPLPIVIVQHMPPLFTAALAERLQRESGRPCREAVHGEPLQAGVTYVAPGDRHLRLAGSREQPILQLGTDAPVNFCRPAADPTLESAAALYGAGALAVVLTGMGEDGVRGCRSVVARGGRVVAQDAATSVVWGMPGAVVHAGLASAVLPLERIAAHLQQLCAAAV